MTIDHLLFDSRGTINRGQFWLAHLLLFPMEAGAAYLFRVHENYLCAMNPAEALGKVYYGSLAVMALVFLFMWYCVVIKRLRDRGRGHASFFAYAVPILATLSVLAPHIPLSCSVGIEERAFYLLAIIPFWLIYFVDLGLLAGKKTPPTGQQPDLHSSPGEDEELPSRYQSAN